MNTNCDLRTEIVNIKALKKLTIKEINESSKNV